MPFWGELRGPTAKLSGFLMKTLGVARQDSDKSPKFRHLQYTEGPLMVPAAVPKAPDGQADRVQ
jgi:hypothetical protein